MLGVGSSWRGASGGPLRAGLGVGFLVLLCLVASTPATAQVGGARDRVVPAGPADRLTLAEALDLARRNNPGFLSQANDQAAADWGVREAYGGFLPSVSASGSASYTEAGIQRIGTLDFGAQSTDWYSSRYRLALDWRMDGNTLFAVPAARASQRSTTARIQAAAFTMEQGVTLQYMTALRARDALAVARKQLERAERNLAIVRTRVSTGAAAGTEATQAEVTRGRAEVAVLRAERDARAEVLRLAEQLGVTLDPDVELVDELEIFAPEWDLESLLSAALGEHPTLRAARAAEAAQEAQVRQAWSGYLPTVSLSTQFSGNTLQALNEDFVVGSARDRVLGQRLGCEQSQALDDFLPGGLPGFQGQDCSQFVFSDSDRRSVLAQNAAFPFDFTPDPVSLTLQVSVPVFQGFSRQRQLEEAEAASRDAQYARRADELRIRTAVSQALDDLRSAYLSVGIEERNLELAGQQLEQARQRYAVGNTSILELQDAETSLSTAERDYLDARYSFHQSLTALEASVGRGLRPGT